MNNDLISREALKAEVALMFGDKTHITESVCELINSAPTVTPKQGEWVVTKLQNIHSEDVYCPFCNARPTRSEYGYYLRDNFCHECGADMRKGEAE